MLKFSDRAYNILGNAHVIVSQVSQRLAGVGHNFIRFWCGAHQIDLFVLNIIIKYRNKNWYYTLTALTRYFIYQKKTFNHMCTKCTKVAINKWLYLGMVIPLLARHQVRTIKYLEDNNPQCKTYVPWYIYLIGLH